MRLKALRIFTTLVLLAMVLTLSSMVLADTIFLANGGKLEGEIIKQDTEKVVIKTKYGTQTIDRMDIDRIDQSKSEKEEYEEKKSELKDNDAEGHSSSACGAVRMTLKKKRKPSSKRRLESTLTTRARVRSSVTRNMKANGLQKKK